MPVFALENRYLLVVSRAHDFDTRRLDLTLLEDGTSFGDEKIWAGNAWSPTTLSRKYLVFGAETGTFRKGVWLSKRRVCRLVS